MSGSKMTGEKNGIALWNIMSKSSDKHEREYFVRLSAAASKYGVVWFIDSVTERESGKNQVMWQLTWNSKSIAWNITRFHVPHDALEITDRMKPKQEVIKLDIGDLVAGE